VEELQIGVGKQHVLAFTHQVDGTLEAQGLSLESIPADVDENLLRQILTNLLSNAIKYSPQGSTVQFSLIQQDDKAIFKIQDFGMGIPPKEQTQLFESFYRATNVNNMQGTGIGLAIVKNCVELHGGDIRVESAVGVGTTFTVTLPTYRPFLSRK
jgi:signal transduction histidine kinase